MTISAVIPTLDRPEVLLRSLQSLLNQTARPLEIIVVDQSQLTDSGVMAFVQANQPILRYFKSATRGSPMQRNYGIAQASGEIVFSGDDDIVAHPALFENHLRNYADPRIGGVAGRVLTREDKPPERVHRVGRYFPCTGLSVTNFNATFRAWVQHGQGSNLSFRRDVLNEVGGFDSAFSGLGHFEELDLCLKVRRASHQIVFDPSAVLQHLQHSRGGNRPRTFRDRTYWQFFNAVAVFARHAPRWALPGFLTVQWAKATGYALRERDPDLIWVGVRALAQGLAANRSFLAGARR